MTSQQLFWLSPARAERVCFSAMLNALSLDLLVRILVLSSGVLKNQPNCASHNNLWEADAAPKLLVLATT